MPNGKDWRCHRTIADVIKKLVPAEGGCLVWPGKPHTGYGVCSFKGRNHYVHRLIYEHLVGPVPEGMEIRHYICHNGMCANIEHLTVGTPKQNAQDKIDAGRQPRGEQVNRARLTADQVVEIRNLYQTGEWTMARLAQKFCIDDGQVCRIIHRKAWAHVDDARDLWEIHSTTRRAVPAGKVAG